MTHTFVRSSSIVQQRHHRFLLILNSLVLNCHPIVVVDRISLPAVKKCHSMIDTNIYLYIELSMVTERSILLVAKLCRWLFNAWETCHCFDIVQRYVAAHVHITCISNRLPIPRCVRASGECFGDETATSLTAQNVFV